MKTLLAACVALSVAVAPQISKACDDRTLDLVTRQALTYAADWVRDCVKDFHDPNKNWDQEVYNKYIELDDSRETVAKKMFMFGRGNGAIPYVACLIRLENHIKAKGNS